MLHSGRMRGLTRRSVLGSFATASAGALGWLGCDEAAKPILACRTVPPYPVTVACDPAFKDLVGEIIAAPRGEIIDRIGVHLRGGLDLPTLLAANFHAGIRTLTPSAGAVMHSILAVSSANLVGAAVDPLLQLAAVLWSTDNVKAEQGPMQSPLPPLDEPGLPATATAARQILIDGLDGFDEDRADLGAAAMHRLSQTSELANLLLRYSARDQSDAHRQIFVAQSFRALDAFGWGCAEQVVRFLARVLAEGVAGSETMATYGTSLALAEAGVELGGTRCGLAPVLDFLSLSRVGSPDELRDAAAAALADGLCPAALWDAVLAAACEVMLRGNGGSGLHYFDAVNAMRWGASRATAPELPALLLLQAAAWIPLYRAEGMGWNNPPPFREIDIDRLAPGLAPDHVEALFERGGDGRGSVYDVSPAEDALAWFSGGGSVCEYLARGRQLVVEKGIGDAHFYKFPAAVFEEIERVDPYWMPRFLATELLVNPSPTRHDDWPLLDEALALGVELGLG